jgi:CheY-like chemotaxis protein
LQIAKLCCATANPIAGADIMTNDRESTTWESDLNLFREVYRESERPEKISILVVEDCEEDFFLITRCLNAMGDYDVSVSRAADLEAASRLANTEPFDLAIVDYWLGKDSGPHVLRHLGGRKGKIPAILVTGLDHPVYKRAGLKAGAIQCMSKDMLTGSILQDAIASTLLTHRIETGSDKDGR